MRCSTTAKFLWMPMPRYSGATRPPAPTSRKWTSSPPSAKSSPISNASTAWPSSRRTSSFGTRRDGGSRAMRRRSRRRPIDGDWKLLTSHPRPDSGIALVSADITEMKRAQIAHLENAEIFRCITESHPLPVWVVDEESKQILYESLDASNLLGREWRPDEPQYMTAHFDRPGRIQENPIAGRQARNRARPGNPAQASQRLDCLVLDELPARLLSRAPDPRHRRARHHRAQAARRPVRLPDQEPSFAGLDE